MQGYKAKNGNYITGKEIEQRQRKLKKERVEYKKQKEQEEQRKQELYFAQCRQEKQDQEKAITEQKQRIIDCKHFLDFISKNYDYKHFLIAWDICNYDHYSLQSDLYRGKINKDMIKTIYDLACNMIHNVNFYIDNILMMEV